jgi:hypothetical protein
VRIGVVAHYSWHGNNGYGGQIYEECEVFEDSLKVYEGAMKD